MRTILLVALCTGPAMPTFAQENGYAALLRRCAENEVKALQQPHHFQFIERLEWSWGAETRVVIETSEGRVHRIIEFNDEPLAPDQHRKQQRRLEKLLRDKDARRDEVSRQQDEVKRRIAMARALPDAMVLEFSGVEPNGELRFLFSSNPKFNPPSRETHIYKGMAGTIWLDSRQERIARIEGRLIKDVKFGWGIFGHLDKGGEYQVVQTQVSPGVWRITRLNISVKGRAFLFNSLKVQRDESNSSFVPSPAGMTYLDAVQALLVRPQSTRTDERSRPNQ